MNARQLTTSTLVAIALSATLGVAAASAQDTTGAQMTPKTMEHNMMDHKMMDQKDMKASRHTMPATVDAVDHTTGMLDVTSENMKLKVHFPPASLADVNVGDKIMLHLGFSK